MKVLSSAEETANDVKDYLDFHQQHNPDHRKKQPIFYTTGSIPMFKDIAERWLDLEDADVRRIQF